MQHQRLTRSRTEVVVSGVCGGLGEYFGIDPVIIRLIFVLVTLTAGLGLLIYPALWIAMPKAPPARPSLWNEPALGAPVETYAVQRERVASGHARVASPPPPSAYKYDPLTGEPIQTDTALGQTTQLPYDPSSNQLTTTEEPTGAFQRPRRAAHWFAFCLIGVGVMILADQMHIDVGFIFPLLMIVGGILLLRRK